MVYPVEEFIQININYCFIPFADVLLCLFDGLVCIAIGAKTVTVCGKLGVNIWDIACWIIRFFAVSMRITKF